MPNLWQGTGNYMYRFGVDASKWFFYVWITKVSKKNRLDGILLTYVSN
ncbi:hypothetical protein [Sporosarcina sp. G11-34]|nr:hypothetical protein [Sporosarcina sp. G11-34]